MVFAIALEVIVTKFVLNFKKFQNRLISLNCDSPADVVHYRQ